MGAYAALEKATADSDPNVQNKSLRLWINGPAEDARPFMERHLQSFLDEAENDS